MSATVPAVPAPSGSLRARKRAAAHLSIRRSAITLALEHGYENVTVDMICSASMVSQRTFFNYFGSKEGVYLSPGKAIPAPELVAEFVKGTSSGVFKDLFTMIAGTVEDGDANLELFQARHQLIHQTPELLSQEIARIGRTEESLVGYVMDRFRAQGRNTAKTPDLEDEARMVVFLVSGAMRFTMAKWVAGNFTHTREELLNAASELIQRITANEH